MSKEPDDNTEAEVRIVVEDREEEILPSGLSIVTDRKDDEYDMEGPYL